jgi:hypothetical protein
MSSLPPVPQALKDDLPFLAVAGAALVGVLGVTAALTWPKSESNEEMIDRLVREAQRKGPPIGRAFEGDRGARFNALQLKADERSITFGGTYPALVRGLIEKYQALEQRIARAYQRKGDPADLEAQAAQLLHRIEGLVSELEESGEEALDPLAFIAEAAFAEAYDRAKQEPRDRMARLVNELRSLDPALAQADAWDLVEAAKEASDDRAKLRERVRSARGSREPVEEARAFLDRLAPRSGTRRRA